MLPSEIIDAWKNDEEYRTNTGASQRHLPDNPAGLNSLTDEEIAGVVAGGTGTTLTTITTIFITWITCRNNYVLLPGGGMRPVWNTTE